MTKKLTIFLSGFIVLILMISEQNKFVDLFGGILLLALFAYISIKNDDIEKRNIRIGIKNNSETQIKSKQELSEFQKKSLERFRLEKEEARKNSQPLIDWLIEAEQIKPRKKRNSTRKKTESKLEIEEWHKRFLEETKRMNEESRKNPQPLIDWLTEAEQIKPKRSKKAT